MSKTPPTTQFSIDSMSIARVIFIGAVAYGLWQIKGILLVILTSVVVASFVHGGARWMSRFKIPRSVAVVLIYVLGFALFGFALWLFIPVFLDELIALSQLLPDDSALSGVFGALHTPEGIQGLAAETGGSFDVIAAIRSQLSATGLFQGVSAVFGGIINFVLMLVVSFYLSMEERATEQFLRVITPQKHEEHIVDLWHRSRTKIGAWFKGQLVLALILACLTYVGLIIIGVPYALMLSIMAALFGLVPYGIVLGTVPALLVAFLAGGWSMVAFTVALYFLLQQLENHVLQPLIISKVTGVPALVVLLSVVIGVKLLGFLGLILAVPLAVVILEVVNDRSLERLASRKKKKTT